MSSIEPEKEKGPVCPYCNADPMDITIRTLHFGNGMLTLLALCAAPDCRKVLSLAFIGTVPPQITTSVEKMLEGRRNY